MLLNVYIMKFFLGIFRDLVMGIIILVELKCYYGIGKIGNFWKWDVMINDILFWVYLIRLFGFI